MKQIQKFIDFIKGHSSVEKHQEESSKLTPEQSLELYNMIKDCCVAIGDVDGVELNWQNVDISNNKFKVLFLNRITQHMGEYYINNLNNFMVKAKVKIKTEQNIHDEFLKEIESAKSQLASEDFILSYERSNYNEYAGKIIVKHKSFIEPKRMGRAI